MELVIKLVAYKAGLQVDDEMQFQCTCEYP